MLGSILTGALRDQALDDSRVSLTQYTNGVLGRHLVSGGKVVVTKHTPAVLLRDLKTRPDIVSVKVWQPHGVLAWTNVAPERIGQRFKPSHHLEEVFESGKAEAELESLHDAEDAAESKLGIDHVIEVYAPLVDTHGSVIGAYEIYADSSPLEASIADRRQMIWLATGAVFAALWALLVLLVRGASSMLRRQTDALRRRSQELLDSYSRLQESAIEAIESLNATVEAKDPYTAGHSLRVQQIALSVGSELGVEGERLEALRHGALFHDIGKLAVPDAVLTKPARLTPDEYELIKKHSADGARIVDKLSSLRCAVPIIHHHHERWDGGGYPDGLGAEQIPVEAAIVGLADAWDAMTTDRPYQRALTLDEALAEVRNGRGSQFVPAVVDAFLAALAARPADFTADVETQAA